MDLNGLIRALGPGLKGAPLAELEAAWTPRFVRKGEVLAHQGDQVAREIMVLDGRIVSQIYDAEGGGAAVAFCVGPGFITPHIARTRHITSLVTLEVTEDATIAEMRADTLLAMMLQSPDIRDWANGILRGELSRKTDREWCLAALGGSDRLVWFRDRYPGYEDLFPHSQIASFLGMTPVTLSRLRKVS